MPKRGVEIPELGDPLIQIMPTVKDSVRLHAQVHRSCREISLALRPPVSRAHNRTYLEGHSIDLNITGLGQPSPAHISRVKIRIILPAAVLDLELTASITV